MPLMLRIYNIDKYIYIFICRSWHGVYNNIPLLPHARLMAWTASDENVHPNVTWQAKKKPKVHGNYYN